MALIVSFWLAQGSANDSERVRNTSSMNILIVSEPSMGCINPMLRVSKKQAEVTKFA